MLVWMRNFQMVCQRMSHFCISDQGSEGTERITYQGMLVSHLFHRTCSSAKACNLSVSLCKLLMTHE